MVNLNNEIIKNQIKLEVKDMVKLINDYPEKASDILERYHGCGFIETIFKLVDSLED